ncbi:DUF4333 domain-containing protein [Marinitenerispora sediminis]|uniref:DUF4333 domain-containing protein n=1 Tax=Marinitenerispora sediminis TaxID=1931232 RepID=UPI001F3A157A|nr:DUF4333 domain-containing protein [Marinitenerispora sediminis]
MAAGPAAVLLAAAGCSFSLGVGGASVGSDDVANEVARQLEEQVGRAPDDVSCPENLPGEVGASVRCELTADGEAYGVTVTVTEVEGTRVAFDVRVDDQAG